MRAEFLLAGLWLASSYVDACEGFREPAISFAGIATQEELSAYHSQITDRLLEEQRALSDCQEAEWESTRGRNSDLGTTDRHGREMNEWLADFERFNEQLYQAGQTHLALLAAQPFKGSYDGEGRKTPVPIGNSPYKSATNAERGESYSNVDCSNAANASYPICQNRCNRPGWEKVPVCVAARGGARSGLGSSKQGSSKSRSVNQETHCDWYGPNGECRNEVARGQP